MATAVQPLRNQGAWRVNILYGFLAGMATSCFLEALRPDRTNVDDEKVSSGAVLICALCVTVIVALAVG